MEKFNFKFRSWKVQYITNLVCLLKLCGTGDSKLLTLESRLQGAPYMIALVSKQRLGEKYAFYEREWTECVWLQIGGVVHFSTFEFPF